MVITANTVVAKLPDDVTRTTTLWPFVTVPGFAVKAPPSMLYSPPVIEIAAGTFMPANLTLSDVTMAERATPACPTKVSLSGVGSGSDTTERNGVIAGDPTASANATNK